MKQIVAQGRQFVSGDLWRVKLKEAPPVRAFFYRALRIVVLATRGFRDDQCLLWASALTFYVLLSIVPVLAMGFGVAKGFGFEKMLRAQLMETLPKKMRTELAPPSAASTSSISSTLSIPSISSISSQQPATQNAAPTGEDDTAADQDKTASEMERLLTSVIDRSYALLDQAKGGLVAGVGLLVLVWSTFKALGNIESSFNAIWGVKRGRSFRRQFANYVAVMLIAPALLAMAGSLTLALAAAGKGALAQKIGLFAALSPVISAILKMATYAFTWVLISFMYVFIPNTKVSLKSAIIAGLIASVAYQIIQSVYFRFQVGTLRASQVYGAFVALPLFLTWVQMTWMIVLFGAELCFAHQNVDTYEFDPDCQNISHDTRRLLALRIAQLCAKRFEAAEPPLSDAAIAYELGVPIRLTREIVEQMREAGILAEVRAGENNDYAYQPAFATQQMTVKRVIDLFESRGSRDLPFIAAPEFDRIRYALGSLDSLIEQSPTNVAVKEL